LKHWKFYATWIFLAAAVWFLYSALLEIGSEGHFNALLMSMLCVGFAVCSWLDYKEIKKLAKE